MSISQCATEPGLADAQTPPENAAGVGASKLLKGLLIGFAITVTIALALASWYVGGRIVAANEIVPTGSPAQVSKPLAAPPATQEESMAEAYWYNVRTPSSELYLQVASLGPTPDSSFVKSLEAKGYRARIQNAEKQDQSRILIGPFEARSSLEAAQRKLRSAGVLAIETAN
jgi:cell division septation protein DedD